MKIKRVPITVVYQGRRDLPRGSNERKRRVENAQPETWRTPLTMDAITVAATASDHDARRIFAAIKKRERKAAKRLATA